MIILFGDVPEAWIETPEVRINPTNNPTGHAVLVNILSGFQRRVLFYALSGGVIACDLQVSGMPALCKASSQSGSAAARLSAW